MKFRELFNNTIMGKEDHFMNANEALGKSIHKKLSLDLKAAAAKTSDILKREHME